MSILQDALMQRITPGSPSSPARQNERRGSRRCKITQLMRLRPSDPEREHFEDLRDTVSVSRGGVYFHTTEPSYEIGMRLFVTMPYKQHLSTMSREYLAEVVRRDELPTGMYGIGFKILMEMGMQHTYSFSGPPLPRK